MGNNERRNGSSSWMSVWKGKGAAITLAVCFVGVIALVGAFTLHDYRNRAQELTAQNEDEDKGKEKNEKDESKAVTTDDIVLPKADDSSTKDKKEEKDEPENGTNSEAQGDTNEQTPAAAENQMAQVWFDDESTLEWPTSGSVIISYSMDKTVYFSTLDQYKYNPALIIGGNVGEDVRASAPGFVTNVEQNAQTGTTVTLDMGNGYSAIYGQLADVSLEIGDYVNVGDILGHMSEPTKYYSVEGPNLYFEIQKDGNPVNPLDFVE